MQSLKLKHKSLWRLFCRASVALSATGMLLAATSAVAACGDPMGFKPRIVPKLPALVQPGGAELAGQGLEPEANDANSIASIVGLWHVTYTSGGETLYESFDQWHSDGTELENPNLAPATGPLCVGVWKRIGPRTFQLHHVGWNFDVNGNSLGTFTLDETNQVGPHGITYDGTFDLKFYDVDGKLVQAVTGTQTATRITIH
jgi:hypothetical protein